MVLVSRVGLPPVVAVLGLAGACGSSADGGSPEPPPTPEEQLAADLAAATCAWRKPCCEAQGFAFDQAACERVERTNYELDFQNYEGLNVRFDATAAEQCLLSMTDVQNCTPTQFYAELDPCRHLFVPQVREGGSCEHASECIVAVGYQPLCNGTCGSSIDPFRQEAPHAQLGGTCRGTCMVPEGVPCSNGGLSAPDAAVCVLRGGLYCSIPDPGDPTVPGTCQVVPKLGEPCPEGMCELGTFCDRSTQLCRPHLQPGEPCVDHYDCRPHTCQNGVCAAMPLLDSQCVYQGR